MQDANSRIQKTASSAYALRMIRGLNRDHRRPLTSVRVARVGKTELHVMARKVWSRDYAANTTSCGHAVSVKTILDAWYLPNQIMMIVMAMIGMVYLTTLFTGPTLVSRELASLQRERGRERERECVCVCV